MTDKLKRPHKPKKIIGRVEPMMFLDQNDLVVPARIDTGAKTSAVWATNITERDGVLSFTLFGEQSPYFTGEVHHTHHFWTTTLASSMGAVQQRYVVRLRIKIAKRRMTARFTLADRSTQVYPVLVGRNVLRGKFVVDVKLGKPDYKGEQRRSVELHAIFNE